jgi:uncharacterized membrane protein YdfJ with MMPL/SSD domain
MGVNLLIGVFKGQTKRNQSKRIHVQTPKSVPMINFLSKSNQWSAVGKANTAYQLSFNKAISNLEMVQNEERAQKAPPKIVLSIRNAAALNLTS